MLGPVGAVVDGRPVAITSPKQRAVLAALALADGSVVSVGTLLGVVWGEDLPAGALGTLQSYVSRLRRVIGAGAIVLDHGGYRLESQEATTDLAQVRSLVDAARAARPTEPAEAADRLAAALGLWRGRPLGDIADNLALFPDVARLEELRTSLVDELHEARLDAGQAEATLPELEAAAAAFPVREPTQLLLMRALRDAGRPVEALRVADRYRRRLVEETGLDPGPEIAALEQSILLGHRPTPAPSPAARPVAAALPRAGHFVGRRRELADVRRCMERERLVTLVGPGGVGKTRLVAELLAAGTEASTAVADLTGAGPGDVVAVVATALGLRGAANEPAVTEYLAGGRYLLVLDNCEHVIDDVRSLVRSALLQCPGVRVLATSRARLALADEQVVHIEPLEVGDGGAAVELFVDRFRRAAGVVDVDDDLALSICRRLEGLPLAVELAASAAAALGPMAMRDRLDGALGLLDLPGRGTPGRHESLRAVIEWSHRLVEAEAARLLAVLSVFESGFTVDAVDAVGRLVVDNPAGALVRLVDASLVIADRSAPVVRFRLLDSVRRFASEQAADRSGVAAAHADFYRRVLCDLAVDASGPEEPRVAHELLRERDNIRRALRWMATTGDQDGTADAAVALARILLYRPDAELLGWLRQAADDVDNGSVLGAAARAAFLQGDLDECAILARRAVAQFGDEARGDADLAWHSLAVQHLYRGEHADAASAWEQVLAENDGMVAHADALGGLALARLYGGDEGGARDAAAGLAALAEALGSPTYVAFGGYVQGELTIAADPDGAVDLLAEAVTRSGDAGADFVVGLAGTALVSVLTRTGRHDDALPRFADLIELWRRSSTWPQQWTTLRLLAELLAQRGDLHTAGLLVEAADRDPAAPAVTGKDAARLGLLRDRLERDLAGEWATVRRTARVLPRARVVERALTAVRGG